MSAGCENADSTPHSPTYVSDSEVVDLDPLAVRSPGERVDRPPAAFCGRRLEVAVYGKPLSYRLDRTFRVLMKSDSGTEKTAVALYDLPSGWSFSIPGPEDSICQPHASCTSMFLKQLEFGLRFPLHHFISLLLRRAHVAITKLHPLAIRTMVAWTWLPPVDVITEDLYLSLAGLLPARPPDTYPGCWSKEELARISLKADSTPVINAPDVSSPSGKISLRTKIMELKKLGPGEAKAQMPLHRSEEPAGPSHTRVGPAAVPAAGLVEAHVPEPESKLRADREPARFDLGPSNGMEAPEVAEEVLQMGPSGSRSTKRLKIILSDKVTVVSSCPPSQGAEEDLPELVPIRASGVVFTASDGAVAARAPSVALIVSTEAVAVGTPIITLISSTGAAAVRAPGVALIPSTGAAAMGTPSVTPIPSTGAAAVIPDGAPKHLPSLASFRAQSAAIGRIARSMFEDLKSFGHGDVIHALNRAQELCREVEVKFSAEVVEVKGELVDVLSKFGTQKDELRAANDKCELVGAERDKLREELVLLRGELEASRVSEAAMRAKLESDRVSEAMAKTAYAGLKGTLDQVNALRVEAYNKGYVQGDLDTKDVVAELYPNFDFEALLLLEEERDKRRAAGSFK
ncbi:hypothetical protein RND81_09G129000 [Saponaria officinalis]|uniref:Uncharacterized protein n=1 Tax=Saponaria officinalis TaxID=3572 RepID=A0AAW1IM90_SAPOF